MQRATARQDLIVLPNSRRQDYARVRHPLNLGFLIAFWATPVMTIGHPEFAMATTSYTVIDIPRGARSSPLPGDAYLRYRDEVPMILPVHRKE